VLLLWCGLLWAGRLLDVDDQLLLSLVLVDGAGWVVDLLVDVEPLSSAATVSEPVRHERRIARERGAYMLL
jgi:hypothetical protein